MYTAWQGTCKALISVIIYVGYLKVLTGKLLGACVVSVTRQRDRIANHLGRRASEGCLGSGNDCVDLPWSCSLKWEGPNCGRDIPRAGDPGLCQRKSNRRRARVCVPSLLSASHWTRCAAASKPCDFTTVVDELRTRTSPFFLKFLVSEYFIMVTGKETKN